MTSLEGGWEAVFEGAQLQHPIPNDVWQMHCIAWLGQGLTNTVLLHRLLRRRRKQCGSQQRCRGSQRRVSRPGHEQPAAAKGYIL